MPGSRVEKYGTTLGRITLTRSGFRKTKMQEISEKEQNLRKPTTALVDNDTEAVPTWPPKAAFSAQLPARLRLSGETRWRCFVASIKRA